MISSAEQIRAYNGPAVLSFGFRPFFLGAAARVLLTGRDVEFVIAGAGPEEENLRRLARELQIVSITGRSQPQLEQGEKNEGKQQHHAGKNVALARR